MKTKTCASCKVRKLASAYGVDRAKRDGLISSCKACVAARDSRRCSVSLRERYKIKLGRLAVHRKMSCAALLETLIDEAARR